MRIKKWEKWYWGIICVIIISLLIWIVAREKGFVFTNNKTGEEKELSKLHSALIVLAHLILALWGWVLFRFWLFKTNDFTCKYCRKEYGGSFETEKEVCRDCYKKKKTVK